MTRTSAALARSPMQIATLTDDAELIERRRAQLIAAATQCFGTNGYHRTTIKEIADVAGFSPGLIYTYVKEKEDVLFLVIVAILEAYARDIPRTLQRVTDPLERFRAAVDAYCHAAGRHVDAIALAYRETKSLAPDRQKVLMNLELDSNRMISDCLMACVEAGYFRPVNLDLMTYRIVLLAHGWALKHWHFKRTTTLEEYIREGLDLFQQGLLTEKGWQHWRLLSGRRRTPKRGEAKVRGARRRPSKVR